MDKNDTFPIQDSELLDLIKNYEPTPLYNLEVMGVGTPMIEAFSGYIKRLAFSHSILVSKLMTFVFNFFHFTKIKHQHLNTIDAAFKTEMWTKFLVELTDNKALYYTNLKFWDDLLVLRYSLRILYLAWCPRCLSEAIEKDSTPYEPLLFRFRSIEFCPIHSCLLETTCPHCSKNVSILSGRSCVGHCNNCGGWLGYSEAKYLSINEHQRELVDQAKRLIMLTHQIERPIAGTITHILDIIYQHYGITRHELQSFVGIGAINYWTRWLTKVRLDFFLELCRATQGLPFEILLGNFNQDKVTKFVEPNFDHMKRYAGEDINDYLARLYTAEYLVPPLQFIVKQCGYTRATSLREFPNYFALRSRLNEEQRQFLEKAVAADIVVSFRVLLAERGYSYSVCKYDFPEHFYKITNKNKVVRSKLHMDIKAYLDELILYSSLSQFPSNSYIAIKFQISLDQLLYFFANEIAQLNEMRKKKRKEELDELSKILDNLAKEPPTPPIAMTRLAKNLGCDRDSLKRANSDAFDKLNSYFREWTSKKRLAKLDCIKQCVFEMHKAGKIASAREVCKHCKVWMRHGTIYHNTFISTLRELGYDI